MFDIDLGPLITFLFVILILLPAVFGLLVGLILSRILVKKFSLSKQRKILLGALITVLLTLLFPFLTIKANSWYSNYENKRQHTREKSYLSQNLNNFKVEEVAFDGILYSLKIKVPRGGTYRLMIQAGQNNNYDYVVNKWKEGIPMKNGSNIVTFALHKDMFSTEKPINFSVKIENIDDTYALRNTRKSLVVVNRNTVIKKEGIIYYSPEIMSKENCPNNYLNWLGCAEEPLLHFVPED